MLERHAERLVGKVADDVERGVGILDVVVRHLLTLDLPGEGQGVRFLFLRGVENGLLVRILAVAQRLLQVVFEEQLLRQAGLRPHVTSDHRVVLRRMRIGLGREFQSCLERRVAGMADLVDHAAVVGGVADHSDVAPVLGGAAQHRRAADVDVLDGVFHRYARLGDGSGERIKVDTDQVDEFDAVFLQGLQVRRQVATAQQGAVHLRVQGLHAAVADFGEARHLADADGLDAFLLQQALRAARGDDFPAEPGKGRGEGRHARLVADTYQCSHFSNLLMVST